MDLVLGNVYNATPEKFLPYGAVVRMDDGSTALIHVSKISSNYVRDPSEYLELGRTYIATAVKGSKHPVELSLIPLNLRRGASGNDSSSRPPHIAPPRPPKPQMYSKPKPAVKQDIPKPVDDRMYEGTPDLDAMIAKAAKAYQDKTGISADLNKRQLRRRGRK